MSPAWTGAVALPAKQLAVGVALGAVAALALGGSPAWSGEYHVGATLICEECHGSPRESRTGSGTPTLKGRSANDVCLFCHDGKPGIPDVRGSNVNAQAGPRPAGALTAGGEGWEDWKGHTLGSTQPPPGGSMPPGETELRCVSCHDAHGNANYRNLGGKLPNPPRITYAISPVPGNATDVRIDLPGVPPVGNRVAAGFYSATRIFFNRVSSSASSYGTFCAGCHNDFHGIVNTGGGSPFRRHPTEAVSFSPGHASRYRSHANRVPVMIAANAAKAAYGISATVSCMSCHRAHGNRNPFGLIFMRATGEVTEEGVAGGRVQDLCAQCHGQEG
jgi:cytochrome c553